jgi:hypothetical protein
MSKIFLLVVFFLGLLAGVFVFAEINYPVEELGNCQNETECKAYCNTNSRIEECLSFAEKHNLLSPAELVEAEKIARVWRAGVKFPGNCQNKPECLAYCDGPAHIDECLDFAETAELISPQELREARQVAKALAMGLTTPGGCWGKKECDAYCSGSSHWRECVKFAKAAGLISAEEAAEAEKVMPLMAKGESPGNCKTKQECEAYCAQENHLEECVIFAQKAGLMTEEEMEMFRKTKGKGPGGCKSKIECDAFCNNPANQEICFEFALDHDLIPLEKLQEIKEGTAKLKQGLAHANFETLECIKTAVGKENLEKIKAGTFLPTQEMGDQIGACFDKYMSPPGESTPEGLPGGSPPEGFIGPGGCTTPEQCETYCSDPAHYEECLKFMEF